MKNFKHIQNWKCFAVYLLLEPAVIFSCFYYHVATHLSIPLSFRTLDNTHSSRNFRQCTSPKRGVSDARLRMCLNIIFLKVVDFGPAAPVRVLRGGHFCTRSLQRRPFKSRHGHQSYSFAVGLLLCPSSGVVFLLNYAASPKACTSGFLKSAVPRSSLCMSSFSPSHLPAAAQKVTGRAHLWLLLSTALAERSGRCWFICRIWFEFPEDCKDSGLP